MLDYYSPDGVHVVQGYVFYIPAFVALLFTLALCIPSVGRKLFPKVWIRLVVFVFSTFLTGFLWLFTWANFIFTIHVYDQIRANVGEADIRKVIEREIGFPLPKNSSIELAVSYGAGQGSSRTFGIKGGSKYFVEQALASNFEKSNAEIPSYDLVLSLIQDWRKSVKFRPDAKFSLKPGRDAISIYIDTERDAVLIDIVKV